MKRILCIALVVLSSLPALSADARPLTVADYLVQLQSLRQQAQQVDSPEAARRLLPNVPSELSVASGGETRAIDMRWLSNALGAYSTEKKESKRAEMLNQIDARFDTLEAQTSAPVSAAVSSSHAHAVVT